MAKSFEQLDVFESAINLMVAAYQATGAFPKHELYGLVSQMRRAAVSVVSHIAEGQGRLTWGEWRQLLSQGRGSLYEVEAQLIACERLGYLTHDSFLALRSRARQTGRQLAGLIRYVRTRESAARARRSQNMSGNRQPATG